MGTVNDEDRELAEEIITQQRAEIEQLRELFRWIGNSTGDPAVLATVREALGRE